MDQSLMSTADQAPGQFADQSSMSTVDQAPGQFADLASFELAGPDNNSIVFRCAAVATARDLKQLWAASTKSSLEHVTLYQHGIQLNEEEQVDSTAPIAVRYSLAGGGCSCD